MANSQVLRQMAYEIEDLQDEISRKQSIIDTYTNDIARALSEKADTLHSITTRNGQFSYMSRQVLDTMREQEKLSYYLLSLQGFYNQLKEEQQ